MEYNARYFVASTSWRIPNCVGFGKLLNDWFENILDEAEEEIEIEAIVIRYVVFCFEYEAQFLDLNQSVHEVFCKF